MFTDYEVRSEMYGSGISSFLQGGVHGKNESIGVVSTLAMTRRMTMDLRIRLWSVDLSRKYGGKNESRIAFSATRRITNTRLSTVDDLVPR